MVERRRESKKKIIKELNQARSGVKHSGTDCREEMLEECGDFLTYLVFQFSWIKYIADVIWSVVR